MSTNFFWFWTSNSPEVHTETQTAPVIKVDKVSDKLISSWTWEVLLYWVLFVSVLFAYFTKKIA